MARHLVTGIAAVAVSQYFTSLKFDKEEYNTYFKSISESKKLQIDEWRARFDKINPQTDPIVLYQSFVKSAVFDRENANLEEAVEDFIYNVDYELAKSNGFNLWQFYMNTCRTFLETNQPDVGKTVFQNDGTDLQTLNGLLAFRLANIPKENANHHTVVVEQLQNYEGICSILHRNKETEVLKKALTFNQLYDLCTTATDKDYEPCKQFVGTRYRNLNRRY